MNINKLLSDIDTVIGYIEENNHEDAINWLDDIKREIKTYYEHQKGRLNEN